MALYKGIEDLRGIDVCEQFYQSVYDLIQTTDDIVLDFSNIKYISSTGIGKLMKLNDELASKNKTIKVVNISGGMRRILTQIDAIDLLTHFNFD